MDEITNRKWAEREKIDESKVHLLFVRIEEGVRVEKVKQNDKGWRWGGRVHKGGRIMRRKYYEIRILEILKKEKVKNA